MTAAVEFAEVVLEPAFHGATRAFGQGAMTAVITSREDENSLFSRAVTGLAVPESGRIVVLGEDLARLSPGELHGLRRRIGIVHEDGGLISNLKVLENIALPLLYHSDRDARDIEGGAVALLERLGYQGNAFELPGLLPRYDRRLTGLARAMAMDPDLVVYDRLLDGLPEEERAFLARTAAAFHGEKDGRSSVFVTSNPASLDGLPGMEIVHLRKGRFE